MDGNRETGARDVDVDFRLYEAEAEVTLHLCVDDDDDLFDELAAHLEGLTDNFIGCQSSYSLPSTAPVHFETVETVEIILRGWGS